MWLSELGAFCSRPGAPQPSKPVVLAPECQSSSVGPGRHSKRAKLPDNTTGTLACRHVAAQIQAIREADFAKAFGMNSTTNRDRLGDPQAFEFAVRGSESFRVLLEPESWDIAGSGEEEDSCCSASVRVSNRGIMTSTLIFDLSRDSVEGAWLTDGVRVEC